MRSLIFLLLFSSQAFGAIQFTTDKNFFFETYGNQISVFENFDEAHANGEMRVDFNYFSAVSDTTGDHSTGGLFVQQREWVGTNSPYLSASNFGFIRIELPSGFNFIGMDTAVAFPVLMSATFKAYDVLGNVNSININDIGHFSTSPSFIGVYSDFSLSSFEFKAGCCYMGVSGIEIIDDLVIGASPVPLPAGIYLFLSGLVGLGLMRGRNG